MQSTNFDGVIVAIKTSLNSLGNGIDKFNQILYCDSKAATQAVSSANTTTTMECYRIISFFEDSGNEFLLNWISMA